MKAKDYKQLIIESINEEIEHTSEQDLLNKVRDIFESEMIHKNNEPHWLICKNWLQGLCSTVNIPFTNYDIINWLELKLKREITEKEECKLIDNYWDNMGKQLYFMLYKGQ
jgi:hypothetical protein